MTLRAEKDTSRFSLHDHQDQGSRTRTTRDGAVVAKKCFVAGNVMCGKVVVEVGNSFTFGRHDTQSIAN